MLYSRYNTVVWKSLRRGTVLSLLPVGNSTTMGDLSDNKRPSYLLPREKLSYYQGAVEPVVHHWSRSLIRVRWTSRDVSALSVHAVKQTDCHHHRRRRREIRRRRRLRFCSPLRRWYLRCLLIGIPLFLRTVRCGRPVRNSLDYCIRYFIALFVPSCIYYNWMHWFVL